MVCYILSLWLFVACNQSRHITSDKNRNADIAANANYLLKIDNLTKSALSLVGKSYRLGSSGPKAFDCSGFTSYVFNKINISLPRMATDQSRMGTSLKMSKARPGDLVFFGSKSVDHVALITKVKGSSISIAHATSSAGVIEMVLQDSDYWMKRFKSTRRVIY